MQLLHKVMFKLKWSSFVKRIISKNEDGIIFNENNLLSKIYVCVEFCGQLSSIDVKDGEKQVNNQSLKWRIAT